MIRIIIAMMLLTIMVLLGVVYQQRLTINEQQRYTEVIRTEFHNAIREMNQGE